LPSTAALSGDGLGASASSTTLGTGAPTSGGLVNHRIVDSTSATPEQLNIRESWLKH
jgi:hypothetical protein